MGGDRLQSRPLRAPAGIASDIGNAAFSSAKPSPSHVSLSGLRRSLFSAKSSSVQVDPWLKRGERLDGFMPPSVKTYERFKLKLDGFRQKIEICPDDFRQEVEQKRIRLRTRYPMFPPPEPVFKAPLPVHQARTTEAASTPPRPHL